MPKHKIAITSASVFVALLFPAGAVAANPCAGKPDSEVRLDRAGGSLEGAEIVDQDSVGVCYAATMATVLQSAIPGHPDVSYIDYAIQYKKAQYSGRDQKIMQSPAKGDTLLDGGSNFCNYLSSIKKGGLCSRDRVALEAASLTSPDLQIGALRDIGGYFDLQRKQSKGDRQKLTGAVIQGLDAVREGARAECANFPSHFRKFLSDIYFGLKSENEAARERVGQQAAERTRLPGEIAEARTKIDSLKARKTELGREREALKQAHQAKVQEKTDKPGIIGRISPGVTRNQIERLGDEFRLADLRLESELLSMERQARDASWELENSQRRLKDLESQVQSEASSRARMAAIGTEVPDPNAAVAGATRLQFSPDLERKLTEQYRAKLAATRANPYQFDHYSKIAEGFLAELGVPMDFNLQRKLWDANAELGKDLGQSTPERCLSNYVANNREAIKSKMAADAGICASPALMDASLQLLTELAEQIDHEVNGTELLGQMGASSWQFMDELVGSNCDELGRIKVPQTLTCNSTNVGWEALSSPGKDSLTSPSVTARMADKFRTAALGSLRRGVAIPIGVCADFFDHAGADSAYGHGCDGGFHAVTVAGYRCKGGQPGYLIQNSWGSSKVPSAGPGVEWDGSRVWLSEKTIVRNLSDYAIVGGVGK